MKEFSDLPSYFDTNSCAEFQWKPLHELLIKYHANINNLNEHDVREKLNTNSAFKRELIMSNLHIITNYFDARCINYYATVSKEIFQISDVWWRYEFAKSRGEIHSHAVISSAKHARQVENAMQPITRSDDQSQDSNTDSQQHRQCVEEAAEQLRIWLQTTEMDANGTYSPQFVSLHPAGGQEVVDHTGSRTWLPNKDKWAAPEGTQPPPDHNPLALDLNEVVQSEGGIPEQHVYLVNRLALHQCSSYCLRYRRKKPTENEDGPKKYCRFHFGDLDPETKKSSGKEIHPFNAEITNGDHPRYEGPRDHPRHVQHVRLRILSWLANCDSQVLIDQDLVALQKYISGYACKGAATTEDLIHVYRHLIQSVSEESTVKNLAQRLLIKTVGMVDVPGAAADFINTGGRLHRCTRNFNPIGISGMRTLNVTGEDGTATRQSRLDKFLSEKRREEQPDITLWDWAKKCNCKCKVDHVPVFTGLPVKPVWPVSEEYSKAMLMIFSPGTWRTTEDLLEGQESYAAALANFLESHSCPTALTQSLKEAKKHFDKKKNRQTYRNRISANNDSQSTYDASQASSQNSCAADFHLGRALMRDIAESHLDDINDPHAEQPLPNGGPGFDWHSYALQCFGSQWPADANTWLKSIAEDAEQNNMLQGDDCSLPAINLLTANELQRAVIGINLQRLLQVANNSLPDGSEPLRLLIQGTAWCW